MEKVTKKSDYFKEVARGIMTMCDSSKKPIITKSVSSIMMKADKKFGQEISSRHQLKEQISQLLNMLSGTIVVGRQELSEEGKRVYKANTFYLTPDKESIAFSQIDRYFGNNQLAAVPSAQQLKYDSYLRKLTIEEFNLTGEKDPDFVEALSVTKDNYGPSDLGLPKLRDLIRLLGIAEKTKTRRIQKADLTDTSFRSVESLIKFQERLSKFKISLVARDVNQSLRGRKPIEFNKTREVMGDIADLAYKIYGETIQIPPVPGRDRKSTTVEILSPSPRTTASHIRLGGYKPEVVTKVSDKVLTDLEKKIVFYTLGMVSVEPLTIDDILKVFRDNTYCKIVLDVKLFREIIKKVSDYIVINGYLVSVNRGVSPAEVNNLMDKINPDGTYDKFVLITSTGLETKDIPFPAQLEFSGCGVKAWRFKTRKNFHDFKKLANFIKYLRPGDRLIAQDIKDSETRLDANEISNQLESPIISAIKAHNNITELREFSDGLSRDKSYSADKVLWEIEESYL